MGFSNRTQAVFDLTQCTYIYVTDSNQVGLCAITIMFAQLHLGRKALPPGY